MSYFRKKKYHIKHTKAFSEAVFTLYRIAFGLACNSYRIGLLFTRKKMISERFLYLTNRIVVHTLWDSGVGTRRHPVLCVHCLTNPDNAKNTNTKLTFIIHCNWFLLELTP